MQFEFKWKLAGQESNHIVWKHKGIHLAVWNALNKLTAIVSAEKQKQLTVNIMG